MDVETVQRAFAKSGNGKLMALWSSVSTKQRMGSTVPPAARRVTRVTSGATPPGTPMQTTGMEHPRGPGSTVHLRATLGMMFPVYPSAVKKGRNIGGVTQRTIVLNGSTALHQAR